MVHDISMGVVVRQRVAQRKFFFKVDVLLTYTQNLERTVTPAVVQASFYHVPVKE